MKASVRYSVGSALKFVVAGFVAGMFVLAVRAQTASPFNLPLYFEANPDQTEFLSRGSGYQFLITAEGAQIALRNGADRPAAARISFDGGNVRAAIRGDGELAGKINYLIGSDSSKWQTGLPTFSQVRVSEIYPGIDLVFHGNQQQLEYDFAIAPGANPSAIKMHFDGVDKIFISPDGELVLKMGAGEIHQPKPEIYQTVAGNRKIIDGGYKILDARTVAFDFGSYDHSLPLVIDPLLSFSSYFGLNLGTTAWAIARDNTNDFTYIAGQTFSKQFFTKGAFQTNFAGGTLTGDAFVAKFGDPATNLIYLTYLGGSGDDAAYAIAVDSSSHAFITGLTQSPNFPTNNPIPGFGKITGNIDPNVNRFPADIFVTELSSDGSSLVYSTYFGGNATDGAYGIALDSADNAYITGFTYSKDFPIYPDSASVFQDHLACSNNVYLNANAFVAEIPSGGNANPVYSSYLGGTNFDIGRSIAVDADNNVYVAGYTKSFNFPVFHAPANAFTNFPAITNLNGTTDRSRKRPDAFVTKFPPLSTHPSSLSSLVYSTFLGGTNEDRANGIAVDSNEDAYVTGWTTSRNFPVVISDPNTNIPAGLFSFVSTNSSISATNAFLTKISADGSQILDSVVFGGSRMDIGYGVAVDSAGDAFVVGSSSSTNFPTVNTFNHLSHTNSGGLDVFVTSIKADWSAAYYSVLIGGRRVDQGYGIALDSATNAYITGSTISTNFPTQFANRFSLVLYTNTFNVTNFTFVTNIVDGTNVITTNTVLTPTNILVTTNFINGSNFINGAKFMGTNSAFLAEIEFSPPGVSNVVVTPPGATNGVGATVTFKVTGEGGGAEVLFQWQRGTNVIVSTNGEFSGSFANLANVGRFSGVNADVLTITNIQTNDTGFYSIVVTSGGPPSTNLIFLDVEPEPIIVTPPVDQTNVAGDTVTFNVSALGQPTLHYQWQLNGTNLVNDARVSGATNNTLTIKNLTTSDEGTYLVTITNAFGVASTNATLTVIAVPTIITPLTNQTVGLGATNTFALTVVGGPPLHFTWTMNGNALTDGGRISGATSDTLTLTGATTNDDGTYEVTVTNGFGSTNSIATLTVLTAPMFTSFSLFNPSNPADGFKMEGTGCSNGQPYILLASSNIQTASITNWTAIGFATNIPSPGSFRANFPAGSIPPVLTNWSQAFFTLVQSNSSLTNINHSP